MNVEALNLSLELRELIQEFLSLLPIVRVLPVIEYFNKTSGSESIVEGRVWKDELESFQLNVKVMMRLTFERLGERTGVIQASFQFLNHL